MVSYSSHIQRHGQFKDKLENIKKRAGVIIFQLKSKDERSPTEHEISKLHGSN